MPKYIVSAYLKTWGWYREPNLIEAESKEAAERQVRESVLATKWIIEAVDVRTPEEDEARKQRAIESELEAEKEEGQNSK